MKSSLFIMLVFTTLISSFSVQSQHLANSSISAITPDQYYLQVKQFGEFIDRFNYKTDWKGNSIDSNFEAAYPRKVYLNFLLNAEDKRLNNATDSTYNILCDSFFTDVVNVKAPLTIALYSGQVIAKATVNITYMSTKQTISVFFAPEILTDHSVKWVINSVEASCFNTLNDSLRMHFIAPNSNETSFINLKRMEQLSNPIYFMSEKVTTDTTLLFMTEVAAGRLTINHIEKVIYLISFPGWQITTEEFIRSNYNSGWLISNITRTNHAEVY